MKATFEHSIDVLVRAYLNDTLQHNNCTACAVGNMIADALKFEFKKTWAGLTWENKYPEWIDVFCTTSNGQRKTPEAYEYSAKYQIDSTGYPWQDLAKIEYAFETAPKGNNDDDWMFNGLMAVVDVLADIHGIDLKQKEQAKEMFKKASV